MMMMMMMMEEQGFNAAADRISALPDDILAHILSFLPTKTAVTTCLVSKRWKSSWLDVHNLDFCFTSWPLNGENEAFIRFVDNVFHLTQGKQQLNQFSLDWLSVIPSHLVSWIDAAISRNVHEITLGLFMFLEGRVTLQIGAFNSDSLRYLELDLITFVYDTIEVCLPRLETLKIDNCMISEEAFEKLMDGCPVLRRLELCIYSHDEEDIVMYRLSSLSLTYLDLNFEDRCILKLMDAPSLEYLRLVGDDKCDIFVDKSLSSLVKAHLGIDLDRISFVYDTKPEGCLPRLGTLIVADFCRFKSKEAFEKLIDGCPVLHHLELCIYSRDDAKEEDIIMYKVSSPSLTFLDVEFRNTINRCSLKLMAPSLEYLEVDGKMSEIFVEKGLSSLVRAALYIELDEHHFPHNLIVEVVRALEHAKSLSLSAHVMKALGLATTSLSTKFKRLETLVVKTDCCCYLQEIVHNSENLEELVIYQRTSDFPHDHSRWTAHVVVPKCLSKTLKKVQFIGYSGLEDERETLRFMFEHGTALEVVQIDYNDKLNGETLLEEICEFPRNSPACEVSTRKVVT